MKHSIMSRPGSYGAFWKIFVVIAAVLLLLLLSIPAGAATYFVATKGKDSNPGTKSKPWRTVGKAAKTLVAGDNVYIRAGVYKERVVPKNSGKLGKYITYAAYPGEKVIIDGKGITLPEWTGLFFIGDYMKYIRVTGLRVVNSKRVGILADNSRHIIIEKCFTYNTVEYVDASPEFVNAGKADYHLQKSSPAIDKGSADDAPREDYEGALRPWGEGFDIGAFEYGSS